MTSQNPTAYPLGGVVPNGTLVSVDMLTKSPTVMYAVIQKLVASNQGYFAAKLLRMPGMSVEGGAILYQDMFPQDLFLDPTQDLAPRSPGAESPLVGSTRRPWKVAKPQSLAGKIEVTDEARLRNNVIAVQQDFTRLANSFADRLQTWALASITAFIAGLSGARTIAGTGWRQPHTQGITFADPMTTPAKDFGNVLALFIADKSGVRPDTVVLHQNDAMYLRMLYGGAAKLSEFLASYGITDLLETPLATEGQALFVKGGEMGVIAFEKPLSSEQNRGPVGTWKDIYAFEARPVFVVNNATALAIVTGINATS